MKRETWKEYEVTLEIDNVKQWWDFRSNSLANSASGNGNHGLDTRTKDWETACDIFDMYAGIRWSRPTRVTLNEYECFRTYEGKRDEDFEPRVAAMKSFNMEVEACI